MPNLSRERRRELYKQAAAQEPDLSDMAAAPVLSEEFYRPLKVKVTLRLDADLVEWLKSGGSGWQTRANMYLRQIMRKKR